MLSALRLLSLVLGGVSDSESTSSSCTCLRLLLACSTLMHCVVLARLAKVLLGWLSVSRVRVVWTRRKVILHDDLWVRVVVFRVCVLVKVCLVGRVVLGAALLLSISLVRCDYVTVLILF